MLNWDVNDRNLIIGNNAGFNIYKSSHSNPVPNSQYVKINSNLITINAFDVIQYIDSNVNYGNSYHYKIQSIDVNGNIIMHNYVTFTYNYENSPNNNYPSNKIHKTSIENLKNK